MPTGVAIRTLEASAEPCSGARQGVFGETESLSLDFTDDFFKNSQDFNGSAYVLDASTPANDFDGVPDDLLTYTSPSIKNVLDASGNLTYAAHNLYLNSASPADQGITVVSGQTYKLLVTGTVSITASGAATGTATAGSPLSFTAATTTLTLGSTSGSGTAQVFATPADESYVATAGSAAYALPYDHDTSGTLRGLLVEPAATNLITESQDFTAWTNTNSSDAQDATGPDGVANSASTLTGDGVGSKHHYFLATTFAINTDYTYSVYLKAGTNNYAWISFQGGSEHFVSAVFDLTGGSSASETDVGSTSGTINSTLQEDVGGGWYRCTLSGQIGLASSTVVVIGIAEAATGNTFDSTGHVTYTTSNTILVHGAQFETGFVPTSLIKTYGATATRAVDNITLVETSFPDNASGFSVYAEGSHRQDGDVMPVDSTILGQGDAATPHLSVRRNSSTAWRGELNDTGADAIPTITATYTAGSVVRLAGAYQDSNTAFTADGATVATDDTFDQNQATYNDLRFGHRYTTRSDPWNGHIRRIIYLPRVVSDADLATWSTAGDLP